MTDWTHLDALELRLHRVHLQDREIRRTMQMRDLHGAPAPRVSTMTARQAAYLARRRAAGWRRVNVWLDPHTLTELSVITADGTSAEEAMRRAVQTLAAQLRRDDAT